MKDPGSGYLTGKLLLAMPSIGDPRFHRSVIFIAAHDEHGAMGLVVNFLAPDIKFAQLLDQLGLSSDIEVDTDALKMPVINGGPIETSRGFLLHSSEFNQNDTIRIGHDFSITGTTDALKDVIHGNGPENALFILGYAGWTPGQLESELQQNAWLVSEPDSALIFHDKCEDKWNMAMDKMGLDPAMLSGEIGRA